MRIEALEPRNMLSITVDWLGDESAVDPSMSEYTAANKITWRSAIERANYTGDDIGFNVTGTIYPGSALPALTHDGITIIGPSEYGIILDGTNAGSGASGLVITASDCVIEGLIIQHFAGAGVKIDGSGLDEDELVLDIPLFTGALDEYTPASLTLVNGSAPITYEETLNSAHGNLIDGNVLMDNGAAGVLISHASVNTITGNTITGTTAGPGVAIVGEGGADIESTIDLDVASSSPSALELHETITITSDANRNTIAGNTIEDNDEDGILVDGASYNFLGGSASVDGNTIINNGDNGIEITGHVVQIIFQVLSPWLSDEVDVTNGRQWERHSESEVGPEAVLGLAAHFSSMLGIADNAFDPTYRVKSTGAIPTYNRIQRNFIGTNADGDSGLGNTQSGILVTAAARLSVIGSESLVVPSNNSSMPAEGNVIGANGGSGIEIDGNPLNEHSIDEPSGNYGDHVGATEVFALNEDFENNLPVFELVPTIIAGNTIGADPSGAHALGNAAKGVYLLNSRAFVVNNVIVASGGAGLEISGAPQFSLYIPSDNEIGALNLEVNSIVQGNRIGVGWDGARLADDEEHSLGNGGDGVVLAGSASFNNIGASTDDTDEQPAGARDLAQRQGNVISNNVGWGVHVAGLGVFHVEGPFTNGNRYLDPFLYPEDLAHPYGTLLNSINANLIGTDASGLNAAGNGLGGVLVDQAAAFTVIGDILAPLERQWYGNVISANGGPGVKIAGRGTMVNVLGGNFIGLGYDRESGDGDTALGNNGPGVWIADESTANNVGGDVLWPDPGSRNYIAANIGPGVLVENAYDLHLADLFPGSTQGNPRFDVTLSEHVNSDTDNRYFTNVIDNCWIGLGVQIDFDVYGLASDWTSIPIGNFSSETWGPGDGVRIVDSSNTGLGAAHPGCTTNTISANQGNGVAIIGTEGNNKTWLNFLTQSYIGTDPTGLAGDESYANAEDGVLIEGTASYNVIQSAGTGAFLWGAALDFQVAAGHVPGDVRVDELKSSFHENKIGNVISNNGGSGIEINGASNNVIGGGNFIGVGLGEQGELPNGENGILMTDGAQDNLVLPWARANLVYPYDPDRPEFVPPLTYIAKASVIRGNTGAGIKIEGAATTGNIVSGYNDRYPLGLYIAIAPNQITGNADGDVWITDGASYNEVHAGPGDNHFRLESGFNVAFGDDGDDVFDLSLTRSIVVGGAGADTFHESSFGENIVVTGDVVLSSQELRDVVTEWYTTGSGHDFADRVDNLADAGSNYGGTGFLIGWKTVFDDHDPDVIVNEKSNTGEEVGLSWYFLGFADDKYYSQDAPLSSEVFTNISPGLVTAVYSDVSTDPVVLVLDAGDLVRYVVDGEDESTVPLSAEDFGYCYLVDWDGDGDDTETLPGGAGPVEASDVYTSADPFLATIQVKSVRTPVGPAVLFVSGTNEDDDIVVSSGSGTIDVDFNNSSETGSTSTPIAYVVVYGAEGNDAIDAEGLLNTAIEAHGGLGDDTIHGGSGDDTLGATVDDDSVLTEAGDDWLYGGDGDDQLDGGTSDTGNDWLYGGLGNDRIIVQSGSTVGFGETGDDELEVHESGRAILVGGAGADTFREFGWGEHIIVTGDVSLSEQEFEDAAAEWFTSTEGHEFADRVDNLSGEGSTYSGTGFLLARQTVLDDREHDVIVNEKLNYPSWPNGGLVGKTWYFLGFADDKYYSQDYPASAEVFTNVSPLVVRVTYSAVSTDPVVLTLDAGDAVRYVVEDGIESTVALYAPSFGYSYLIDWDNDGIPEDTVAGGAGPAEAHDDFTTSDAFVAAIQVKSARTPAGPMTLFVGGSDQADDIYVYQDSGATYVNINDGFVTYETSESIEYISVYTQDGNDVLMVGSLTGAYADMGAGNDTACVYSDLGGRYTLLGGIGEDTLAFMSESGSAEEAFVDGGDDNDIIVVEYADGGEYRLKGGAGNDMFFVLGGVDARFTMAGGAGDDAVMLTDDNGASGLAAIMYGGAGDDMLLDLSNDPTAVTIFGGKGKDTILGGTGADYLNGGAGDDVVVGGLSDLDGGDTLLGGDGNDMLVGSDGADSLVGGSGEDLIIAGKLTIDYYGEENPPGVVEVYNHWVTEGSVAERIAYLSNLENLFALNPGQTVLDDNAVDTIVAQDGYVDWIIYNPDEGPGQDEISYDVEDDWLTDIDPDP